MEQIIVTHPNGAQFPLISRQNVSVVTKAEQRKALLGEDVLNITVKSMAAINFYLGDKILAYGSKYVLNKLPTITKTNGYYEYVLQFEGPQYLLLDVQWVLPIGTVYNDYYNGDCEDFLDILIENANRIFPGKWVKGTFPADTEFKNLDFTGKNCLDALQTICSEWQTEFEFSVSQTEVITINLKTVGSSFPYTFKYGRTGGLYTLTRKNVDNKNIITRLYVYGGTDNLGQNYGYNRLLLPDTTRNTSYIQDATVVQHNGIKEGYVTFDDIFPNRIGTVSGVDTDDPESKTSTFQDSSMPFDLAAKDEQGNTIYMIAGVTPKIHFNTGNLAGYEFDITDYDHETKTFTIRKFQDESGNLFPGTFLIGTGDKYIITDINLPDSYIEEAETELYNKALDEYALNCTPQVSYELKIDEKFLSQFSGSLVVTNLFEIGDSIFVQDDELGISRAIRITSFSRNMLRSYGYELTIADKVTVNTIVNIIEELQEINNVITINNLNNPANARRNWMAIQEVLANVFDPEGFYYSEHIAPLSIETTMLAVAAKSQQFMLKNTTFEPNYGGDANVIKVTGGQLIHYAIEDTIRTWNLNTATISNLVSSSVYYVYAKCHRTQTGGVFVIDTTQYTVESDPNYYYFLIGTLSSAITDDNGTGAARILSLTYGATTINGRFIKTGRIMSSGGGNTYFDLDEGEIGGKIKFKAGTSGYNNISDAPDLSGFVSDTDGLINIWHKNVQPTTSNTPASNWNTTELKEEHLGDLCLYQTTVVEGEGERQTETRIKKWYRWIKTQNRTDTPPTVTWSWQEITPIPGWFSYLENAYKLFAAFVTPTPPYDVNDVWINGGVFLKCINAKIAGEIFNDGDWADAQLYDNTQTVINGGMVTSGTIQLAGSDQYIKAGITGQGTAETSVRIWAGDTFSNRALAPFRVLQNGSVVMTNAEVHGKIEADANSIFHGAVNIANNKIKFETNGSGQLANGSFKWDASGNVKIFGNLGCYGIRFYSWSNPGSNVTIGTGDGYSSGFDAMPNIYETQPGCTKLTIPAISSANGNFFFILNRSGNDVELELTEGSWVRRVTYSINNAGNLVLPNNGFVQIIVTGGNHWVAF